MIQSILNLFGYFEIKVGSRYLDKDINYKNNRPRDYKFSTVEIVEVSDNLVGFRVVKFYTIKKLSKKTFRHFYKPLSSEKSICKSCGVYPATVKGECYDCCH